MSAELATRGPRSLLERPARRAGISAALIAALVYGHSLANGFAYDDVPIVQQNPVTEPGASLFAPWGQRYWPWDSSSGPMVEYRPLTVQTYAVEVRAFGHWPLPFHLTNVLLHAAVSAGVAWLTRRISGSGTAALLAGVLFALHPIHTEVVANVVGRAELLAAGGILLSMWLHDRGQRDAPGGARSRSLSWSAGAVLAAGAAIFAKESGIAVVPVLVAWHLWLRAEARRLAPSPSARPAWRWGRLAGVLVAVLGLFAVYLWARYQVTEGRLVDVGPRTGLGNILPTGSATERLLTRLAIVGRYASLMLWPHPLLSDYSVNVFPLVRSPADPHVLVGLVVLALILVGAVLALRGRWTVFLLLACGLASYAVVGNLLVRLEVIFAERLFYTPSLWVCVFAGIGADRLAARLRELAATGSGWIARARRALALGGGVVLASLAALTVARTPAWKDTATLFETDLAAMAPGRRSVLLCTQLAQIYLARGRTEEAEALLQEAASYAPDSSVLQRTAVVQRDLAEQYLEAGQPERAVRTLEQASRLCPENMRIRRMLDALTRARAEGVDLCAQLREIRGAAETSTDPGIVRRWARLADELDVSDELPAHRRWAMLEPGNREALVGLADVLFRRGTAEEAVQAYDEVLERFPDDHRLHANLAVLLCERGGLVDSGAKAVFHARRAVELRPDDPRLRANLADVLARVGDPAEAAEIFEQLARDLPEGSEQRSRFEERAARSRGAR